MKNSRDPRHIRRIMAVKNLFRWDFNKSQKITQPLANQVIKEIILLDKIISKSALEWPIKQINKIDLAILRLAVFELTLAKIDPPKVIIDEAIELAKNFGSEKSASFINGVLGSILNGYKKT